MTFTSTSGPTLSALDHDFHLFGIVPSVTLAIDVPESFNDSFFSGQPYVCNKDKITQPSSPYRHSAELVKLVKDISFNKGGCKPVLIILSDGGPDHRLCYGSVKVSMIALFLKLDLDMLVCMQMCPYQSWTNPAERVMSTLNLALQNVSLMREKMADEMERAIKHKNTLSAIREAIEEKPGLSEAVRDSTSTVIDLLNERFARMKLKGNSIVPRPAASQDDVTDNFEFVHFIDSSLQMGELNQATLKNAKDLQVFMKAHCSSTHYLFKLKSVQKNLVRTVGFIRYNFLKMNFKTCSLSLFLYLMPRRITTRNLRKCMASFLQRSTDHQSHPLHLKPRQLIRKTRSY